MLQHISWQQSMDARLPVTRPCLYVYINIDHCRTQ